jgi:hypothetical protein
MMASRIREKTLMQTVPIEARRGGNSIQLRMGPSATLSTRVLQGRGQLPRAGQYCASTGPQQKTQKTRRTQKLKKRMPRQGTTARGTGDSTEAGGAEPVEEGRRTGTPVRVPLLEEAARRICSSSAAFTA